MPGATPSPAANAISANWLEPSIRVVTALFAVLLGFGLKHILDDTTTSVFTRHKWPCLAISAMIFLRFLLGSANHLWFEYVKNPPILIPGRGLIHLVLDLWFLLAIGFFGLRMCYSSSGDEFLIQGLRLFAAGMAWGFFHLALHAETKTPPHGKWWFMMYLNFAQGIVFVGVASFGHLDEKGPIIHEAAAAVAVIGLSGEGGPGGEIASQVSVINAWERAEPEWTVAWSIMAILCAAILTLDFALQVRVISQPASG